MVLIFALQAFGSQKIGQTYGPVVVTWMLYIGITGIQRINEGNGYIFEAWNPVRGSRGKGRRRRPLAAHA
jgi:K+ transporter